MISLTPLIDVVFILLLFFMLTSEFVEWRSLELSMGGASTERSTKTEMPIRLLILSDDQGFVCSGAKFNKLDRGNIQRCGDVDQAVVVDMEPAVVTQRVISTIEALNHLGYSQVGMGAVR